MITTLPMLERIRQQVQSITVLSPRQHSELLATLGSAVDALQAADDAWLQEELQVASTTLKPHCYDPAVRQPFDTISALIGTSAAHSGQSHNQTIGGNAQVGVAVSGNVHNRIQTGGINYGSGNTISHTGDVVVTKHAAPLSARVFVAPASPTSGVFGREDVLASLRKRLCGPPTQLIIDGMPGAGKSLLALTLAHDPAIAAHFTGGVLMASLGQFPTLRGHARAWMTGAGVQHDPAQSIEENIARLARRIQEQTEPADHVPRPLLVIVDDVWDIEDARALQIHGRHLSYVYTSRQAEIAKLAELVARHGSDSLPQATIKLDPLDTASSVAILRAEIGLASGHQRELEAIADLAGGLPLALNAIGAFLRSCPRHKPDWLALALKQLQDSATRMNLNVQPLIRASERLKEPTLLERVLGRGRDRQPAQALPIVTILRLSIDALPSDGKRALARLAALPHDPVTFGLDAAVAALKHPDEDYDDPQATAYAEDMLSLLHQRNLLIHYPDPAQHEQQEDAEPMPDTRRWRMHRAIWDVLHNRQDFHRDATDAGQQIANWHGYLTSSDGQAAFARWRQHLDNWQQVIRSWKAAQTGDLMVLRQAIQVLVPVLIQHAHWNELLDGLQRATRTFQHIDNTFTIQSNFYLGWVYHIRNEYALAESAYLKARVICDVHDPNGILMAGVLNNLALLYEAQGMYERALPLYERALAIKEQVLGERHPSTASSLNNLGVSVRGAGGVRPGGAVVGAGAGDQRAGAGGAAPGHGDEPEQSGRLCTRRRGRTTGRSRCWSGRWRSTSRCWGRCTRTRRRA